MALDAEALIERQRLRRRLTLWRVLFVIALAAALIVAVGRFRPAPLVGDHVALLEVTGVIGSDARRNAALDRLAEDASVKALIVRIDSPGGTFVGGESLHDALRRVAERKPVVAIMENLAASGGYMVAVASDHILARQGTITGSIGVMLQAADLVDMFDSLGVRFEAVKSDPLKAQPSPFERFTPEARAWTQRVVDEMQSVFVDMVDAGRPGLTRVEVVALADGRIYTGGQALANGLVDGLGGEREARAWLAAERGVPTALPLRKVEIREDVWWLAAILRDSAKSLLPEPLTLDGMLAVWQPDWR